MKRVHKIVVPMGQGAGPKDEKSALKTAKRYAEPGKRLYTDIRKGHQSWNFVQTEKEDFKPGSIKPVQGPNGVLIYSGDVRPVSAPKYKKPED